MDLVGNRAYISQYQMILVMCPVSCLKEQPKVEEEVADKEDSSTMTRPAKRARTSFTVDQLQVLPTSVCLLLL